MLNQPPKILIAMNRQDHRFIRGVARYCFEHGWHLSPYLIVDSTIPKSWKGDGAITNYDERLGALIHSLEMPIVDISNRSLPISIPKVLMDHGKLGEKAAMHFLIKGFRHFAYFFGVDPLHGKDREQGFVKTLRKAGVIDPSIHAIALPDERTLRDQGLLDEFLIEQVGRLPKPLAFFAGRDDLGIHLIQTCLNHNLLIPDEVAVLGVENIEFLCECSPIGLSSINTNEVQHGYAAAQQLHRLMKGEITMTEPAMMISPGDVWQRRSTDVIAIQHPEVRAALHLMRAEYRSNLKVEDLPQRLGISQRGLEKAFKKYIGETPAVVLRTMRLGHAQKMLTHTDMKISVISKESGYSNSSNLSHAFLREFKLSPQTYREINRSELF